MAEYSLTRSVVNGGNALDEQYNRDGNKNLTSKKIKINKLSKINKQIILEIFFFKNCYEMCNFNNKGNLKM